MLSASGNRGSRPGIDAHLVGRTQHLESGHPVAYRTKKAQSTTSRRPRGHHYPPSTPHPESAASKSSTRHVPPAVQKASAKSTPSATMTSSSTTAEHATTKTAKVKPAAKAVTPLEDRTCVFCPIIADVTKAITKVHDGPWNDKFLVLQPADPVTEGHVLVIPRVHVQDARHNEVYGQTSDCASRVAKKLYPGMDVNFATNQGLLADQTVPHLHIHVVPRRPGDGLTNFWTGQEKGHYNTTGKPEHPDSVKVKLPPATEATKPKSMTPNKPIVEQHW